MSPQIYFSYGMTKSGSTLSFELARSALILGGCPQPRLSLSAVENRKKINFCGHIDEKRAAALRKEVAAVGSKIAIKTHTRPDPVVVKMLENDEAFAHATFRDPREIALSMVDHGARNRKLGKKPFSNFRTVEDTLEDIMHQTNSLLAWLSLPNVRPLFYDKVAFEMPATTRQIIDELGVVADEDPVITMATQDRFTQKNKAVKSRFSTELTDAVSQKFKSVFAPMFERLIEIYHKLPRDGKPVLDPTIPLCDWSHNPNPAIGN